MNSTVSLVHHRSMYPRQTHNRCHWQYYRFRSWENVKPDVYCLINEKHKQICILNQNSFLLGCWSWCHLYNEDVILLVRQGLFLFGLKRHAASEVHCYTNCITWSLLHGSVHVAPTVQRILCKRASLGKTLCNRFRWFRKFCSVRTYTTQHLPYWILSLVELRWLTQTELDDSDRIRNRRHSVNCHSSYQSSPTREKEAGDLHVQLYMLILDLDVDFVSIVTAWSFFWDMYEASEFFLHRNQDTISNHFKLIYRVRQKKWTP